MNTVPGAPATQVRAPLILVVEDMGLQIRLIQICLEKANYKIAMARDGEEALQLVDKARPDLILLDIDLPRLNGFQVLDRLRSAPETASIPVIMLSAHSKDAPLFAEWKSEVDVFMTKPFSPVQLLNTVEKVLAAVGSAGDTRGSASNSDLQKAGP